MATVSFLSLFSFCAAVSVDGPGPGPGPGSWCGCWTLTSSYVVAGVFIKAPDAAAVSCIALAYEGLPRVPDRGSD